MVISTQRHLPATSSSIFEPTLISDGDTVVLQTDLTDVRQMNILNPFIWSIMGLTVERTVAALVVVGIILSAVSSSILK